MTVLPMVLLASITSMAEYLNVFLDIQGDLISKSTTMETLKAEMKRSVLLSNVENAKGQPQQQSTSSHKPFMPPPWLPHALNNGSLLHKNNDTNKTNSVPCLGYFDEGGRPSPAPAYTCHRIYVQGAPSQPSSGRRVLPQGA